MIAPIPLSLESVACGFPSPAEDYIERGLDLHEHVVSRPASTFFVRAIGDSMTGSGIFPGDILVVDRAIHAVPGRIVIAVVNGELTVKRLVRDAQGLHLRAENPSFPPIHLTGEDDVRLWGVVTFSVHRH